MDTPKTTIVMVGPTGVGKTSLLAAMYKEIDGELAACGCTLSTEPGPTQRAINDQLKELKKVANGTGMKVQIGEGIDGTQQERRYRFQLSVGNGGEPDVILDFVDLPGGWYTGTGEYERADKVLGESHVSFLAVDATALMESQGSDTGGFGRYHEELNSPLDIIESYKRVNFMAGHIVVLVLIRAESYVKSGSVDVMLEKAAQAYGELARKLGKKNIPLFSCYVETMGSLTFNSFTESQGRIEARFIRDPKKGYQPSRCAIPLRIAAGKALYDTMLANDVEVEKKATITAKIKDWLGIETDLKRAKERQERVRKAFDLLGSKIEDEDFIKIEP
ncbi:MAG: hypothetical protein RLZZ505_2691 [Verrucomicrobiota bacterium]|jgi:GTPase SAR1 family protein